MEHKAHATHTVEHEEEILLRLSLMWLGAGWLDGYKSLQLGNAFLAPSNVFAATEIEAHAHCSLDRIHAVHTYRVNLWGGCTV